MATAREADDFPELSPSVWEQLEERTEAFEAAWARGERPDLEDYRLRPDPTGGQLLVELVFAEFEFRLRAGEAVRAEEYFTAYPELAGHPAAAGLRALERELGGAPEPPGSDEDPFAADSASTGVDDACAWFEREWRSGGRPRIEDYLDGPSEPERSTLFLRLLTTEVALRRSRSESPRPEEYARRFPEYAPRLRDVDWTGNEAASDGPQRFAGFDLLERLGVGGFGVVWKARDRTLDRVVAVKIPHPHRLNADGRAVLLREARAAARLDHPNVVRIRDAKAEGDLTYLVYDYVEGTSLHRWLESRTPTPREAAELCLTLARAVSHAHGCGVIHRDLKPGNVLIDRDGAPHVTDFGLAKRAASLDPATRDGLVTGSLPYMSPEQAAGNSHAADERTDVYGLGVILYELLTGRRPFDGGEAAVLRMILFDDPPAPRQIRGDVPAGLEAVCLKAIEKDPRRRYATAAEFADDLERFLRGERPHVRRRVPFARPRTRAGRYGRLALASLLSPVLLAAVWSSVGPGAGSHDGQGSPAVVAGPARAVRPEPPEAPAESPPDVTNGAAVAGLEPRTVEIRTDPGGARVWLFPRDPFTGWVLPDRRIGGGERDRSPVRFDLPPGEYLIVADLGGGRFVEVDRRVPLRGEVPTAIGACVDWHQREGDSIWMEFDVPPPPPADALVLVPGGEVVVAREREPDRVVRIPDFYLARRELAVGEYLAFRTAAVARSRRPMARAALPPYVAGRALGERDPVPLNYVHADAVLAEAGLRVPDELEWLRAASLGNSLPVEGLTSGLAEWTRSWYAPTPQVLTETGRRLAEESLQAGPPDALFPLGRKHVVRGGLPGIVGGVPAPGEPTALEARFVGGFTEFHPGVGVRAARSVKPRWDREDFIHLPSR